MTTKDFIRKSAVLFIIGTVLASMSVEAQLRVDSYGHIIAGYNTASGGGAGPCIFIGPIHPSDARGFGAWGIEHYNGGLNFWIPYPNANYGNYKLFLQNSGNLGIGKVPSYTLDVNGDIATFGTLRISSDERLKSDIRSLPVDPENLYQLDAKSYYKSIPSFSDEADLAKGFPKRANETKPEKEYGFLAQELQKFFPDLVKQDAAGYYNVNYVGLIPVMVETLKKQKQEQQYLSERIEALEKALSTEKGGFRSSTGINDLPGQCTLMQNAPNPFKEQTEIKYYVADGVKEAYIYIFDMQGKLLKKLNVITGQNSITIHGSTLQAGIYLYSLVADGQEVDTKRMILTK